MKRRCTNFRAVLFFEAVAVVAALSSLGGGYADELKQEVEAPIPRQILALFDGSREAEPRWTRLHRYAELVLNHMGFHVVYHDIAVNVPPETLGDNYAAVLTWFDAAVGEPQRYLAWANRVRTLESAAEPIKLVVFGESGLSSAQMMGDQGRAFLKRLGVEVRSADHRFGVWGHVAHRDPVFVGFERDFTLTGQDLPIVVASSPDGVSHLRVAEAESVGGNATDLVVTAATGGYVHESALLRYDEDAQMSLWVLNPFAFFRRVLVEGLVPIPDTTTLNGRRIFFSNVNGEGWTLPRPSDRPGEPVRLAGGIVLDELIARYPELPVSVGLVTGDLDPELGGRFAEMGGAIASAALSLPHVEAASRTRTLPLRWRFFENYRREKELESGERSAHFKRARNAGVLPEAFASLAEAFTEHGTQPSATLGGALRKYGREPFDLDAEIGGALHDVAELAPADRSVPLVGWGGDADVFEGALAKARLAGVAAIGGGGGMYDPVAPSISNLRPLSAQVGSERQIYDALAGDAAYTNFWTEPIHGLLRLQTVLDATERPRRLKPVQISYTAFSALRFGSLNAVRTLLDRARHAPLIPIRASTYARIAEDFVNVRIVRIGPMQWRILGRGSLQTLRFEGDVSGIALDMKRCQGVLGARRENGAFYVSLDPAVEQAVVALGSATDTDKGGFGETHNRFELDNARWLVRGLVADSCKATFDASGFGLGEMSWHVPTSGSYRVEMHEDGRDALSSQPIYWDNVVAGDDRMLSFALPAASGRERRVAITSCD